MPDSHIDLLEIHAREKAGMPEAWSVYRWQCMPPNGRPTLYYDLTGAVAPPKLAGKGKGRPNWRKLDKTTERTVYISLADHDAWVAGWEAKTGTCRACMGAGRTVVGGSVKDGPAYRACAACEGTGKADV